MRATTLLGDIDHLHQRTKTPLKYVHTNSKYGHIFAITYSETHESFWRYARDKGWVEKLFYIHQVVRRKIRCPWYNTCQSICLINMKMKPFLPLLNVVWLSALPWSHNRAINPLFFCRHGLGRGVMMTVVIIMGPLQMRGEGLEIWGDMMDRTVPRRGGGHFYDKI